MEEPGHRSPERDGWRRCGPAVLREEFGDVETARSVLLNIVDLLSGFDAETVQYEADEEEQRRQAAARKRPPRKRAPEDAD